VTEESGVTEGEGPAEDDEEYRGPLDRDAVRRVVGATTAVIASGDRHGQRDVSVLAGAMCFVRVLDGSRLAFPDEGVEATTALRSNIGEAADIGMLLVGPGGAAGRRALHLNGRAEVVAAEDLRAEHPDLPVDPVPGRATDVWVVVTVGDAYPLDDDQAPPLGPVAAPAAGAPGAGPADGDRRTRLLIGLVALLALALLAIGIAAVTTGPASEASPPAPAAGPPAPADPTGPPTLYGNVVGVPSPGTVVVDVRGTQVTVDVVGIDDAAIPACARPASQAFARTTLSGRTVTLVPDPTLPPAQGTRAYVVLDTQLSYTDAAIGAGAAPAAGPSQYRAVFDTEQRKAQTDGVGMWGPPCTP
jgi:endonuclease YncB( thermonuclease family)